MPMPLKITPLEIPEVKLIETGLIKDDRGWFAETYSAKVLASHDFDEGFQQDNLSLSRKGTLRGLHYQIEPHGMGKLVRVLSGSAFDVAVDIRRGSPTFGKWVGRVLTMENRSALWVPAGFAHGFLALEDDTLLFYKCTTTHTPESERAINYADPAIGIEWPIAPSLFAPKDLAAPPLATADYNFQYVAPT
ncbi:MAG TPA: dTDP-4-dehydrorhamnose 3,5-epimerase [Polyangiaceae bacterium]|jgi:dTDP-4-dehydrorhamnose 3,5-epimerase|nr:dTDP-4-dehydrorhamnose 3,5-epimerase [Polyangiaceae bacterium]